MASKGKSGGAAGERGSRHLGSVPGPGDPMVEDLVAQIATLRLRVKELEAESAVWRKRAKKQRSRVQTVRAEAEKAIAVATAAAKKRAKAKAKAKIRAAIADHPHSAHPRAEPLALKEDVGLPAASWTVQQLRAAARAQGIAGYSRMRKDELVRTLI